MMSVPKSAIAKLPGVRAGKMPRNIEPMKAVLVDEAFSRTGWIFEEKYDGVRGICYISGKDYRLLSRNQKDMKIKYPELDGIVGWVNAKECVLDGEIIVVDKKGKADFQELQARFGLSNRSSIAKLQKSQKVVYYVFDVLYVDGFNVMHVPLLERKALLKKLILPKPAFKFAAHTKTDGETLFKQAEKKHLEGIIAKNALSRYEERRSSEWLKIKTVQRQEAVICGYTEPHGSRDYFGALHLGLYQGKELVSVGKVGSGFDRKKLKEMYDLMKPLRIDHAPFDGEAKSSNRWRSGDRRAGDTTQWLKPKLVCEVRFTERTSDGSFRHPVFEGLRFDKKPTECHYEAKKSAGRTVKSAEKKVKPARHTTSKRKIYI